MTKEQLERYRLCEAIGDNRTTLNELEHEYNKRQVETFSWKMTAIIFAAVSAGLAFLVLHPHTAHADDIASYLRDGQGSTQELPQVIGPYPPAPHTKPHVHCNEEDDHLGHLYLNCSDGTHATTFVGFTGHAYTDLTDANGQHHSSDCFHDALGTTSCDHN